MTRQTIGVIGGGNMGEAIIAGISKSFNVLVCEQNKKRCRYLERKFPVKVENIEGTVLKSRAVIVAVKPQNIDEVLEMLCGPVKRDQLIISIAAGIKASYIEKRIGKGNPRVVRAMPNLPAQVGEGMTAVSLGKWASRSDLILSCRIFSGIGKTVVVEEKWMDAITAASGSGPAYVFYFAELLNKAAKAMGLPADISRTLILQTLKGSVKLLEKSGAEASVLRKRVTSRGGTTQAALSVLRKGRLDQLIDAALKAAKQRSKELAK